MLTATSASVRTHETADHWSYTITNENFFVAAEISGERLKQEVKTFLRLTTPALEKPLASPEHFQKFSRELNQKIPYISCAAGLLINDTIYVYAQQGSIYVNRGDRFGPIITGSGSASGEVKPQDFLLFTGLSLAQQISQPELQKIFQSRDLSLSAKALNEHIDASKQNQAIAVVVVAISPAAQVIQEPPRFQEISDSARMRTSLATPKLLLSRIGRNARPLALLIAGLTVVLLVLVGYGVTVRHRQKQQNEVMQVLGTASHKFEEGMALVDLNPIRARELLVAAKTELELELAKNPGEKLTAEITGYLEKVNQGMVTVSRQYTVDLNSFFELDLVSPQAEGSKMALYQDALIVLDTKHTALYRISISNKAAKVIAAGNDIANAQATAVHGEDVFAFTDVIRKVTLPQAEVPVVIEKSDQWVKIVDMKAFAGNIYLLDTGRNWIWKYLRTEDGYGSLQDYFIFDTLVDLGGADNLTIDGAVWLTQNGKVLKFIQGKEVVWQVYGLEVPFGNRLDIYTDDTTKNIYILDADNQRLVVSDKEGAYLSQYSWNETVEITDLVASEVIKKILLLSRGTIYGIDLH